LLLAWSLYYGFTGSPEIAVAPFLCSVAGLLWSFRLQPRPGDEVEPYARLEGRARVWTVVGRLLTLAGSLPVVLGGLLIIWDGLQTMIGGTLRSPLPWTAVMTGMAGAWLLSVIGMWVTDRGHAIGKIQAEAAASADRPRE
jgi:hypothetical protein